MKRVILALAAIALIVSCAKDEATESLNLGGEAQFTTDIVATRLVSTELASTWELKNQIGISSTSSDVNVCYEVTSIDNTTSTVSFSAVAEADKIKLPRNEEVSYTAYYPWTSGGASGIYLSDVSNQSSLGAIDFLVSEPATAKEGGNTAVSFVFKHKLSMLKFNIKIKDDLKALYPDYATAFDQYVTTFCLEDAVTVASYTTKGAAAGAFTENLAPVKGDIDVSISVPEAGYSDSTPATAVVIVNPICEDVTMNFTMKFGSRVYIAPITINAVAGNKYVCNVELGYNEIDIQTGNIGNWEENDDDANIGKPTELQQGTADNPFIVNSAEAFAKIGSGEIYNGSVEPWSASAYYKLSGEIDFNSTYSSSISEDNPFYGVLDGAGNGVSNLSINIASDDFVGLIPYVGESGEIKNLEITDSAIHSTNSEGFVGAIAGCNEGTISNCSVSNTTVCNDANTATGCATGGIVGRNKGIVDNCVSDANITGSWKVGGVVGYLDAGSVINCGTKAISNLVQNYTSSTSSDYQQGTGGIVGLADSRTNILNCYNRASISSLGYNAGGVVGFANDTQIYSCYNTGSVVAGFGNAAGIVGHIYDTLDIEYCYYLDNETGLGIGEFVRDNAVVSVQTFPMSAADMQNISFVTTLNEAALAVQSLYSSLTLYQWVSGETYPVTGTEKVK